LQEAKYYDHKTLRPIDPESDGCDLAQWDRLYGEARFAKHPKGFRVFLSPHRMLTCDEYADSDPYTVELEIASAFHRRRIELTIELAQEAISIVQGIPRILDLGCGQGHITQELYQKLNYTELSGLDCSISAIEYAHDHFHGIDFAVGDAYEAPYTKGYFDLVVCNNLWEHVPDPLHLLSKIKSILKPGGYVIVSTPNRYRVSNLVRILRGKPVTFMSAHHVTEYTVGQVIEQFAYGGFQVNRVASRSISMRSIKGEVARRLFEIYVSLVGSHHRLETTVFYLGKAVPLAQARGGSCMPRGSYDRLGQLEAEKKYLLKYQADREI
jgi:2-polyprenyl-3-methyl-5-hydroxy-6-metoxy-1,4-benzoquinol methylase